MNRTPGLGRSRRAHPDAEPAELATLRGWLRGKKAAAMAQAKADGKRATFRYLADRASAGGNEYVVCACTLRQALDGRLPTRRTTLAFAYGAGADEDDLKKAERLWMAADRAINPPRTLPAPYVPGLFTTQAGLVRAMNRLRKGAPQTSLRALAARAGPGLSSSTLQRILTGRQMPTAAQLTAFAAACHAGDEATAALLAGHRRLLAGPPLPLPYPCAYAELAEERRQRDEAARPWLAEEELDWYEQERLDEEEASYRRWVADAEALIDEWEACEEQAHGAGGISPGAGPDRRRRGRARTPGPGTGPSQSARGPPTPATRRAAGRPPARRTGWPPGGRPRAPVLAVHPDLTDRHKLHGGLNRASSCATSAVGLHGPGPTTQLIRGQVTRAARAGGSGGFFQVSACDCPSCDWSCDTDGPVRGRPGGTDRAPARRALRLAATPGEEPGRDPCAAPGLDAVALSSSPRDQRSQVRYGHGSVRRKRTAVRARAATRATAGAGGGRTAGAGGAPWPSDGSPCCART